MILKVGYLILPVSCLLLSQAAWALNYENKDLGVKIDYPENKAKSNLNQNLS